MRTKNDYINILKSRSDELKQQFGIRSLRLFGSVARNEQKETSDVDICVETETPNPFLLVRMKNYLEKLLGCSVDIIRTHKNMNEFLKQQIEKDGIYVF
ncbi:MAG: nucleotidyltransferase family protein [Parabacteroides sp.]|nr:nucleotidyltransferase family protein [Parabacteroides sp.]